MINDNIIKILISIIIFIIIILSTIYIYKCKFKQNSLSGGEDFSILTKQITEIFGSTELGKYVSNSMNPQTWTQYVNQITMTVTKLSTEITKITANPFGLLTNVLISPECIKFLIKSTPKALAAKIKNTTKIFKLLKSSKSDEKNKNSDKDVKQNSKLIDTAKSMIKPYIKIFVDLIVMVYKKDLYQPFITPILQLIYKFPLLTNGLRQSIKKVFTIYSCPFIKLILNKSINIILYSKDKLKSIYALFYSLIDRVITSLKNVLQTFIDETKRLIKNSGKVVEDKSSDILARQVNNLIGNISISNALKDPKLNKLLDNEVGKANKSIGKFLNGGYIPFDKDVLFDNDVYTILNGGMFDESDDFKNIESNDIYTILTYNLDELENELENNFHKNFRV